MKQGKQEYKWTGIESGYTRQKQSSSVTLGEISRRDVIWSGTSKDEQGSSV
jgi:hypothetical protein